MKLYPDGGSEIGGAKIGGKGIVLFLTWLYNALLRLFPRSFQAEFADEMRDSFAQAVEEARQRGGSALGRLCLAELSGLTLAGVRAQLQLDEPRQPAAALPVDQPWGEILLALAVFLLPAGMALFSLPQDSTSAIGFPVAIIFLSVMIFLGWLGGFPLWSVPYVGLILIIAGYLHLFLWIAGMVRPALISNFSPGPWDYNTYLMLEIVSSGMLWLMLFCFTLLIVALLAVFNRFQPLFGRTRQDWTLLSYILYGESVFALLLLESHRLEPNFVITSLLCMAAGIWFFLRSSRQRQRLFALLSFLTLAVGISAYGKWPLSSGQEWGSWSSLLPSEAGRLLFSWLFMVAALLLPGLLARWPVKTGRLPLPGSRTVGPPAAS